MPCRCVRNEFVSTVLFGATNTEQVRSPIITLDPSHIITLDPSPISTLDPSPISTLDPSLIITLTHPLQVLENVRALHYLDRVDASVMQHIDRIFDPPEQPFSHALLIHIQLTCAGLTGRSTRRPRSKRCMLSLHAINPSRGEWTSNETARSYSSAVSTTVVCVPGPGEMMGCGMMHAHP